MATVTYESTGTEDITASYFDTESRLEIYQTQRERVLALLEEADTMEDILTLETELARLNYEIDALTTASSMGRLGRFCNCGGFPLRKFRLLRPFPEKKVSGHGCRMGW